MIERITFRGFFELKQGVHLERFVPGSSDAAVALRAEILKAARGAQAILIEGEIGSGKLFVAQAIFELRDHHYVRFSCSNHNTSKTEKMHAEFIGAHRGTWSDLQADRTGIFLVCNGGTVFLDEIHRLGEGGQSVLLTITDSYIVHMPQDTKGIKVSVGLITATNLNLFDLVVGGKFAQDLFSRIVKVIIKVPPLRDRREDIRHFFELFANNGRKRLTNDALQWLQNLDFHWPHNVRDLETILDYATIDNFDADELSKNMIEAAFDRLREQINAMPIRKDPPPPRLDQATEATDRIAPVPVPQPMASWKEKFKCQQEFLTTHYQLSPVDQRFDKWYDGVYDTVAECVNAMNPALGRKDLFIEQDVRDFLDNQKIHDKLSLIWRKCTEGTREWEIERQQRNLPANMRGIRFVRSTGTGGGHKFAFFTEVERMIRILNGDERLISSYDPR